MSTVSHRRIEDRATIQTFNIIPKHSYQSTSNESCTKEDATKHSKIIHLFCYYWSSVHTNRRQPHATNSQDVFHESGKGSTHRGTISITPLVPQLVFQSTETWKISIGACADSIIPCFPSIRHNNNNRRQHHIRGIHTTKMPEHSVHQTG